MNGNRPAVSTGRGNWFIVVIALLATVLSSCQSWRSTPTAASPTPTAVLLPSPMPTNSPAPDPSPTLSASVLRIGWLAAPSLNPFALHPGSEDTLTQLLYDSLIYRVLDNTFAPSLARAWETTDDGTTWRIELNEPVLAHDGLPLTLEDVAFSLQLFRGHPKFRRLSGPADLQQVEREDASNILLTMSEPVAAIEPYLFWLPIVPHRIWQGVAVNTGVSLDPALLVGSGPFRLDPSSTPQRVILRANPTYRLGSPVVGTVEFLTYTDPQSLSQALVDGEVELITHVSYGELPRLTAEPTVQIVSGAGLHSRTLVFNLSASPTTPGQSALADLRVRQAIAHAVDRQQWIDLALSGSASPGRSVVPPSLTAWFDPSISDAPFNLTLARQALETAGYRDTDGDGFREVPVSRQPLHLRLALPADPDIAGREADLLVEWFRQVGIRLTVESLSVHTLSEAGCPGCDYDLILVDWEGGPDPTSHFSPWTSEAISGGTNLGGFSSPGYDELFRQQAATIDQEARRRLVWDLQALWIKERPGIVLYYRPTFQAYRKDRFSGWLYVPNGAISLADPRSLVQVAPVP